MSQTKAFQPAFHLGHPQGSTYLDFIQNRKTRRPTQTDAKPLFPTADEKMMRIQDIIWQIADSQAPVLITGEAGVGKEIVARAIYEARSSQEETPFLAVNCAALRPCQLDAELFGTETQERQDSESSPRGKWVEAEQGILLLDEITETPLALQAKILRAIQDPRMEQIGGNSSRSIQTRILATSSQDMTQAVQQGKFRQDLYYKLHILHLEIPALRTRPRDIEFLAKHFLQEYATQNRRPLLQLTEKAIEKLLLHKWPGNVRELQNVIQRAAILSPTDQITLEDIPLDNEGVALGSDWITRLPIGKNLRTIETQFILETLKHHQGNRTHAAKTLGISLRTLRNKINEFTAAGLEVPAPLHGRALA